MQTSTTSRRKFLWRSTEAVAITALASTLGAVHSAADEKPETVNLGIIGCGGIMALHVQGLVGRRDHVSLAWLCDVDPAQIEKMSKHMEGFQSAPAKRTSRYEEVIEDKQVDAVIIATPHHWHAPIALNAMLSGKDVYIEKPISHVYNEGHAIIQAAKKYDRIGDLRVSGQSPVDLRELPVHCLWHAWL